jgi:Family of unknown function (DUF6502)
MALNTQNSEFDAELGHTPLTRAVQRLFQPIARMLVRRGIGGNSTVEMIKRAYVAATIDVLKERKHPITRSRLMLFTGFPGREIEGIQNALAGSVDVEPSKFDQITRLLTAWHLDSRYSLSMMGTPRELRIGPAGNEPTFTSLVRECAPTLDRDELLEELVRIGAVTVDDETKRARLVARAYVPEPYSATNTERLGRMVRNFTETLESNFQTEKPEDRRVDRHVGADFPISLEDEIEFRKLARSEGQALLESLDRWLQQRAPVAENGRRVGLVVFQYIEGAGQGESQETPVKATDKHQLAPSAEVVGPYFMGAVEQKAVEERRDEGQRASDGDTDDGVIDVLDYRGPKK